MNCKGGVDLVKNFPSNPVVGCNCNRCKNLREMKGKKTHGKEGQEEKEG